jgi:hypothetical protein
MRQRDRETGKGGRDTFSGSSTVLYTVVFAGQTREYGLCTGRGTASVFECFVFEIGCARNRGSGVVVVM